MLKKWRNRCFEKTGNRETSDARPGERPETAILVKKEDFP
jgi:hypothetical protein